MVLGNDNIEVHYNIIYSYKTIYYTMLYTSIYCKYIDLDMVCNVTMYCIVAFCPLYIVQSSLVWFGLSFGGFLCLMAYQPLLVI